ncbi:Stk1 family PASTA domain-containing Ser/Thr kinase [Spirilliplanes yamanashiensis]|uniref:non-specific serine/threonine protein kinase n=1 Tax=Spirilliplanes yamanashiensis TaxID=42233 RepID=A0A8J3Y910_9ACTN|nr:Stk1 family PASTA domain-containing Ser/Thr kinase [Spirilliplanes yamanashiensis]MDP9816901.1 serine/threonine-protein kinase [Spirilliplanes yamanashiensis]GIJ03443.1 serine/threonine protein kinase [Spirilliplanes yamanashiensis]
MDTTVADPLLGALIDGRYRVRGRVARGGMATVYTALDERLERTVALKIIHANQATNVHFLDRFADEAKTIARLTHPNVVAVYDTGIHEGLPYLVMEYVQGRTLRELLSQRRRFQPVEALAILDQMLAAIAAAHRAGLVHRDVKPENVLVAQAPSGGPGNLQDSVVKVADFGLARAVEASTDGGTGQLMATVAYVAPELVTDGHSDARTDVYSAGIVLFEMLTGRVPFDGDQPVEVAWQHVDNDVPKPSSIVPGLPPVLDELVARATRRDPGARPTDAGALLGEVQVVRDDLGAANVETAVYRQVGRPAAADQTAVVPAVPADATRALDPARPGWARLPGQPDRARTGPGRRRHGGTAGLDETPADNRMRIIALVAAALAVLVVAVGAWYLGVGRYTDAPRLVNLTKAEAEQQAQTAGVVFAYGEPQYSDTVPVDVVLSQDPPPDERMLDGDTVTLVLSLGAERHAVPDLAGLDLDAAKAQLEVEKLVLKKGGEKFSDSVAKGSIISFKPEAGTELKSGETVTVVVSKGRAPITVPNFVGKNINDARNEAGQLGLTAAEIYKDSDQPAGQVIGQSLKEGSSAEKGAEVKLEVSKGPPQLVVPRVLGAPCQQAKGQLEGMGLRVRVDFNPNGTVQGQQPGENTPVAPQTEVAIQCF